ncbi:MAG: OmpA family protein [Bacteroidetes bacterium]|nr:OmpA family protein [Bacteroidota bacterium]
MRKQLLTFLLILLCTAGANAQRYIGIATSNYSGTNGLYLNPANIADSRHKFTIDLFSLNFGMDNNYGTIRSSNFSNAVGSDNFKISDFVDVKNSGKASFVLPYAEIRGPGALVSLGRKHAIALTTRVRLMNQVHNIDDSIFQTVTHSNDQTDYSSNGNKFNFTLHGWSEIGLSYGGVLFDNGKNMIKGGLTARYLMGIGYLSVISKNMDVSYTAATDLWRVSNSDIAARSGGINFDNTGDVTSNLFKGAGKGFGGDIGFVYEFRPNIAKYKYDMDGQTGLTDPGANAYMLRFSAAVTDIGAITYKNNVRTVAISNSGNTVALQGNDINKHTGSADSLKAYATQHGFSVADDSTTATKVHLPTALVISADYHAAKGVFVNLMYMGNLANRDNVGNSYYSQITVTPRYDVRIFSAGLPITYSFLSKSLKVGLGLRVSGFFIGSDDILGVISNNAYGANFYFGAYVPFGKRKPKDSDGDLVSNKRDKCPGEKGVWAYMGCPDPDRDHDGIPDSADKCPDLAGSKTAMGCPDADLDSVADAQDRCPSEAGSVAMGGCPDRDGDGIADIDDKCPDQKGLAKLQGCPDSDGDGLADNEDACPNAAGPIANHGCPDSDNDGVPDNEDKCPTVKGTIANHGCPEVSVEVKKRLAFAATAIQFETGKAVIKKTSYPMLNEIVKILNDYPDYYMTIDGHTDNVGKPDKNMQLSKDRAASVKNYFVSQGVAESRLVTDGHGDTQPVASNKTAKGRAQNRRVAMDLKLKE